MLAANITATEGGNRSQEQSVVDWISASPQHTTLARLIRDHKMTETLRSAGPFTVFAPSDEAFRKLPEGKLEELTSEPEGIKNLLLFHTVSNRYSTTDLQGVKVVETLLKAKGNDSEVKFMSLTFKWENSTLMVNDSKVVQGDLPASNGLIHSVDTVLIPGSTPNL